MFLQHLDQEKDTTSNLDCGLSLDPPWDPEIDKQFDKL